MKVCKGEKNSCVQQSLTVFLDVLSQNGSQSSRLDLLAKTQWHPHINVIVGPKFPAVMAPGD